MAGLYSRKNLGEVQLNLKDAVQKLYAPGIQDDIRLFAFSDSLFSEVRSSEVDIDSETQDEIVSENEIRGFLNLPFTDQAGDIILRTKFVTNNLTFSANNKVFFQHIATSLNMDRRGDSDPGAPIVVSRNGGIVFLSVKGPGSKYEVRNPSGVPQIPTEGQEIGVRVFIRGTISGADNCEAIVFVTSSGSLSLSTIPEILVNGSGYIEDEPLEVVRQCGTTRYGEVETEEKHKCKKYSSAANTLHQILYDEQTQEEATSAYLVQDKYFYTTRECGNDGFFLFDENVGDWVYLGDFYDALKEINTSPSPLITLRRFDAISSDNLLNLKSLNANSYIMSYYESYSVSESLGSEIRRLTQDVEDVRDGFKYFLQNNKNHKLETDEDNTLKTRYNIFEGRNFDSSFRVVFRDPDGVLDDYSDVTFSRLQLLQDTGRGDNSELKINEVTSYRVPGLFMNVGGVYIRAFSTDDKPYLSNKGRAYISPRLHEPQVSGNFQGNYRELTNSDSYRYSLSTAYLPVGSTSPPTGFNTEISVLSQNLSASASDGGFVFRRGAPLLTPVVNNLENIIGLPLLDYRTDRNSNSFYSPHILAILDTNP